MKHMNIQNIRNMDVTNFEPSKVILTNTLSIAFIKNVK